MMQTSFVSGGCGELWSSDLLATISSVRAPFLDPRVA
jgi:hypothetical protein